jgi:acyl-CoA hydrolase
VCATKHSKAYCVTVAVEGVEFLSPVEVGDLLIIKASINYVGNSTMIIGMRIECENPRSGKITHTNSCYFTMLAKDEAGNHLSVPGLVLETERQLRRFCEAKRLKDLSKQKREMLKSDLKEHSIEQLTLQCSSDKCQIII